ncbi:MAG: tetratricopeptide repeat protein [bacterium]
METLRDLIARGKQHFDSKQYEHAEDYLRRAVEKDAHYADVFNMLGVIAHFGGKFSSAIELFEKALTINPRYTEAILNLAVLYNDLGQYDKAKGLYARLRGKPGKGDGHIEPVLRGKLSNLHADIGDIYRSIGLYPHAIEEYRKALLLNPAYFDIRTKLGQALREAGKPRDSLAELKSVLRAKSAYSPALVQLGVTYYTMEKIPDAKKAWKTALKKEPENPYASMYLRLCEATERAFKQTKPAGAKKKATGNKKVGRTKIKSRKR